MTIKKDELIDTLAAVANQFSFGPTRNSLERDYARIFLDRDADKVFRFIWSIPNDYNEFPSPTKMDSDFKISIGEMKPRGLTPELINKNHEQLIVSGTAMRHAEKGKALMETVMQRANTCAGKVEIENKQKNILDEMNLEF